MWWTRSGVTYEVTSSPSINLMPNTITWILTAGMDDDFSGVLEDATGAAISITAGSDVVVKVFRGNLATPDLDINGTGLTYGTKTAFTVGTGPPQGGWTLTVHGGDTSSLVPGAYDVKVGLVDAGDSNRFKWVCDGVCFVEGAVAGLTT